LLDDREEEIKKLRKRINRIETKERPDIEGLQEEARGHLNEVRRVLGS